MTGIHIGIDGGAGAGRWRRRFRPARLFGLAASACLMPALTAAGGEASQRVVVTTSMLGSAVKELDADHGIQVVELIPPGSCPGHFDLTPALLRQAREAELFIYHDFQDGLAKKLGVDGDDPRVLRVGAAGGLTLPANYRRLVEAVAARLRKQAAPAAQSRLDESLAAANRRIEALGREMDAAARTWKDRPVAVSAMQREFVERLGMRAVGELRRPGQLSPRDWQRLLAAGPEIIVGNLQSDAPAAAALGRRGGRPVAVLSNFPGAEGFGEDYASLLRANLARLEEAWNKR